MVKRILAVDDDLDILCYLRDELGRRLPDTDIITTASGFKALQIILAGSIDLLITDIALPDIDGYQLFLRAKEMNEDMPVIMITGFGYDPNHTVVNARKAGLNDVLFKPFKIERLIEKIKEKIGDEE